MRCLRRKRRCLSRIRLIMLKFILQSLECSRRPEIGYCRKALNGSVEACIRSCSSQIGRDLRDVGPTSRNRVQGRCMRIITTLLRLEHLFDSVICARGVGFVIEALDTHVFMRG